MPRTYLTDRIYHIEAYRDLDEPPTFAAADSISHDGKLWVPILSGGAFHLRPLRTAHSGPGYDLVSPKAHGYLYRPVDPSMTFADVEGATYAHDTGTHWQFAHCSPDEQVDFAALARTYAVQQFFPAITRVQAKIAMATNATARAALVGKLGALLDFATAVGEAVYETVIGETLGHWHRNPHHDHRRDLAVAAIASVLAEWKKAGLTDQAAAARRLNVTTDAAKVTTALTETHTIEWRHARAARLAAEAKAKEAAAETPSETQTPAEGDGA